MLFGVSLDKEEALRLKMDSLGIKEPDIEEKFIRSGKKGGQNVNKVSTCVYLKYRPAGVEVKCQKERSQALNRFFARRILVDKIESVIKGRQAEKEQKIAKIRRQKRKRSKRAKEKMLDSKKKHSLKKKLRKFSLILFCVFCIKTSLVYSEGTFMKEHGERKGIYVYKKTLEERSDYSFSFEKFSRDGKIFYRFIDSGKGDYSKYEDITWESIAEVEGKEGFLNTVYSIRIIRDKDGETIVKHRKDFDYNKRKIFYTALDKENNVIKKTSFPIKGKTADNITLAYFLKTFVAYQGDKKYRSLYLISNEPRLYRITIKVVGSETLKLPFGEIEAIKLRLIPNLGILTGLSSAIIPPTFIWYTKDPPYTWLQYEGMETGLGSSHIIAYISNL